jgi:hypothetical protein
MVNIYAAENRWIDEYIFFILFPFAHQAIRWNILHQYVDVVVGSSIEMYYDLFLGFLQ